jgi:hypothetical protein
MEIPEHIVAMLREMPKDAAVEQAMELLMQIDVAETMVYERVNESGNLELGSVVSTDSQRAQALKVLLEKEDFFGQSPAAAGSSLAGKALADQAALLVLGQVEAGDDNPLPAGLKDFLLAGAQTGNIGFVYVLPLSGQDNRPLGALTLVRPAATGPLNHEQPNITERVRLELGFILDS